MAPHDPRLTLAGRTVQAALCHHEKTKSLGNLALWGGCDVGWLSSGGGSVGMVVEITAADGFFGIGAPALEPLENGRRE
jgi:hypothetical protein